MKKIFYLLLFGYQLAISQSVTINPQSNNSGIINAESTTKGVLFPSMTTLQRTNIISPQAGLLVFDSTTDSFWYHDGTSWSELNTSNSSQWTTNGNNIYSSNPGNVGIGIVPTKAKLEVSTTATTQAIFGSGGNGISIQKDFPTIGFNQYRDDANVQRYIGTGFAGGNYFDPTNGNLFWSTINTGSAGNPTTGETARMVLKYNGFLGIGTLSPTAMLHVAGFTRLGSDAPSIKMKLITGIIPCLSNNCHSPIPHGLTAAKIISVSVFISTASGEAYAPAQNEATFSGNYYYYSIDATNIDIYHPSSGTANTLGRPYKILITYQE